eukprot:bmy_19268T0
MLTRLQSLSITDCPLHYVKALAGRTETIPYNNKGAHLMLAKEVLHMRGTFSCEHPWEVTPNLYSFRGLK